MEETAKKLTSILEVAMREILETLSGKSLVEFSLTDSQRAELEDAFHGFLLERASEKKKAKDDTQKFVIERKGKDRVEFEIDKKERIGLAHNILQAWCNDDNEKRAVFTIVVDSSEEKINGILFGKDTVLVNGLINLLLNNKQVEDLIFAAIGHAKDEIVKMLTDKDNDHGKAEQQQ